MSAPDPVPPPHSVTGVEPGEAAVGTMVAGFLGYITMALAVKGHLCVEAFGSIIGLTAAGGMALWHHLKA